MFDGSDEHLICEEDTSNKCTLKGTAKCSAQYIILLYLNDCHLKEKNNTDTRALEGNSCTVVSSVYKPSEEERNRGLEERTAFSLEG